MLYFLNAQTRSAAGQSLRYHNRLVETHPPRWVPARHGFRNGKLIQIARSIVVYGSPDKVPEITRRFFSSYLRRVNCDELGEYLEREVGKKSSFKHRPTSQFFLNRAVLSVVFIRHAVTDKDLPYSVPSKFHLLVKNRLHHFRCDNVKHDNYHYEQKERNRQPAKSKNLTKRCEGHNHRHDNSQ
jgi:hypothetical protein